MRDYLSGLNSIMHSKRKNIFYLEKCRVMVKEDRLVYLTNAEKRKLYWNFDSRGMVPINYTEIDMPFILEED